MGFLEKLFGKKQAEDRSQNIVKNETIAVEKGETLLLQLKIKGIKLLDN